jgi:hypothetical protein
MPSFIMKFEPIVPLMIKCIRDGNEFERKAAEADLFDLAKLADLYIEHCQDAAKAKAQPLVDEMMKRLIEKKDKD